MPYIATNPSQQPARLEVRLHSTHPYARIWRVEEVPAVTTTLLAIFVFPYFRLARENTTAVTFCTETPDRRLIHTAFQSGSSILDSNNINNNMNNSNVLLPSLNNMCEVPLAALRPAKKYTGIPRRAGLALSLATLNESKRPGEYYLQKLTLSLVSLPKSTKRLLGILVTGSDTSKDSDDALLVMSQAEGVDLRLSSITAHLLSQEKTVEEPLSLILTITLLPKQSDNLARTRTALSFMLTRTKTKYYNAKETKERQQLRKKVYDDNDGDDEILPYDMDLVFNVPMIKNYSEIYRYRLVLAQLLHKDALDKYAYTNTASMKPCPLPGNLTQSTLSVDTALASMPENTPVGTVEDLFLDNDTEILRNILDFYGQRSVSYSKLVKQTREQHMLYKLPNYIRSQSLIEDLHLISPEKLEMIDQTRPINLPPKCASDKAKHSKEFHRVLSGYELNSKHQNGARKKLGELFMLNQQTWFKLMTRANDPKDFAYGLSHDKEKLRKTGWESLISEKFRFDFFFKVLSANCPKGYVDQMRETYAKIDAKRQALAPQMKSAKDMEFERLIALVLARPVYKNFLAEVSQKDTDFDVSLFRANYRRLLYLKSLSDGGLKKFHEIFVIPMFLIFFQTQEPLDRIYTLVQMFDRNIFNPDILGDLNKKLANWKDLARLSSSSLPYKVLSKFDNLKEFEYLNSVSFFELLIQLNDRLPLSLSAPSTPIMSQSAFMPLALSNHSQEFSMPGSPASSSVESLAELNLSSIYFQSSSLSLIGIFLQLLVLYLNSPKSKKRNFLRLYQTFLLTVFKYYHINWNSCAELVRHNKSIKLNNSNDEMINLESFLDKWRDMFKKS